MTTIYQALEQATLTLTHAGQTNARLEAQILLRHILHIERSALYAYPERVLTTEQEQQFHSFIERRSRGEPIAYLTGHKEFYGLDFLVDKRVLIPRPETELLVETALHACQQMFDAGRTPIVADIGTGSGIIPVTLAVLEPRLPYLYASDISADALDVTYLNCQRHHVEDRVRLLHGDLLAPLPEPIDILTANLPYIGTDELDELTLDVRAYEPHLALFSGPVGLDLLRRFFTELQHSQKLAERAILLLEIGYQQREALTSMVQAIWPHAILAFTKDYACWDRVLQVTL
jgi:release factor glutamine methyltransferase